MRRIETSSRMIQIPPDEAEKEKFAGAQEGIQGAPCTTESAAVCLQAISGAHSDAFETVMRWYRTTVRNNKGDIMGLQTCIAESIIAKKGIVVHCCCLNWKLQTRGFRLHKSTKRVCPRC